MRRKIHAYDNAENPVETGCGRWAYDLTVDGELAEPPLLLITGDRFLINCRDCIKAWNIAPSYQLFTQAFNPSERP